MSSAHFLLSWCWLLTTSGSRSTLSDLTSSWHSESVLSCSPQQWVRRLFEKPLFIVSVHVFLCACVSDGSDVAAPARPEVRFGRVVSRPLSLHSHLAMKLIPCNPLSTAGPCLVLWPVVSPQTSCVPPVWCSKIWVWPRAPSDVSFLTNQVASLVALANRLSSVNNSVSALQYRLNHLKQVLKNQMLLGLVRC